LRAARTRVGQEFRDLFSAVRGASSDESGQARKWMGPDLGQCWTRFLALRWQGLDTGSDERVALEHFL